MCLADPRRRKAKHGKNARVRFESALLLYRQYTPVKLDGGVSIWPGRHFHGNWRSA
jgi:hypothetical protein